MAEGRVVQKEDGKHYREIQRTNPDGSTDFEYIPIADLQVHEQQISEDSHQNFFRDHKQKARRAEALSKAVMNAAKRVNPGAHGGVRQVKDEEFFRLNKMYQDAVAKGEQRQCPFQPLTTYQMKIQRARPILAGEIGVYGAEILTLEPGYGSGQLVQVPAQLEESHVAGNRTGDEESVAHGPDEDVGEDGSVQRSEDKVHAPTDSDSGNAGEHPVPGGGRSTDERFQ